MKCYIYKRMKLTPEERDRFSKYLINIGYNPNTVATMSDIELRCAYAWEISHRSKEDTMTTIKNYLQIMYPEMAEALDSMSDEEIEDLDPNK